MTRSITDKLNEFMSVVADGGINILGTILSETIIGSIAPGVATMALSYKQKRFERMIIVAISEIRDRIGVLENKLKEFSDIELCTFKEQIFPLIFDFIIEEQQEEKITYLINGLETIVENKITDEDCVFNYFDVMNRLRLADLRILLHIDVNNNTKQNLQYAKDINESEHDKIISNTIIRKLQRYDLVRVKEVLGEWDFDEFEISVERVKISYFGNIFIKFFRQRQVSRGEEKI